MLSVNKYELLSGLEARTEEHLIFAISTIQNLPSEILLRPASNGGWSIVQVLEHLNSYGDFYLPEIEKAIEKASPNATENFTGSRLGAYFRDLMDPDKGRKKFRAMKKHKPEPDSDPVKVVSTFIVQLEKLLLLTRKSAFYDIQRVKIPISISNLVKLRLGDVFQFIIAHNERHIRQAKRNLDSY